MKCKRIFASISAASIMAVSSTNVSAVAPEGYDVNNDGRVNIADAVAISMALSGNSKASDNTALDVNNNGVVDHLDYMSIMAYIAMVGDVTITMQ